MRPNLHTKWTKFLCAVKTLSKFVNLCLTSLSLLSANLSIGSWLIELFVRTSRAKNVIRFVKNNIYWLAIGHLEDFLYQTKNYLFVPSFQLTFYSIFSVEIMICLTVQCLFVTHFIFSYRLEDVRSRYSPSFFHRTTGGGCPFGGEHFKVVSSPMATSVSFGIVLKSSRRSER